MQCHQETYAAVLHFSCYLSRFSKSVEALLTCVLLSPAQVGPKFHVKLYTRRTTGRNMRTFSEALSKTASQLSMVGRRVTSIDDLVDLHLDLADGTFAGRFIHTMVDLTLGSEDSGTVMAKNDHTVTVFYLPSKRK